jgi:hypothetical protein
MSLVQVKNFPDRMYAERAQQTLEQEGIHSIIQSMDTGVLGAGGVGGLIQGVDLWVDEEDAERVKEILTDVFDGV